MSINPKMPTMLKDALYNVHTDSGASADYSRGLVVGVVSTIMAMEGVSFETAVSIVRCHLPRGYRPERLPEAFREDFAK